MITVIGAGPIGSHTARLLAEKGHEVKVLEEHSKIGEPVQCTGIVTKSLFDIVKLRKEYLVNKLSRVRVHAPNRSSAEIKINDFVIDRTKFDCHLADQAEKKGAEFYLNHKVTAINKTDNFKIRLAQKNKTPTITTDKLIGADGPNSVVSKHIGNNQPQYWVGVQALAKIPVDKKTYSVYFGKEFPGFFGWVVPENDEVARVGIACAQNPKQVFDRFIKRFEKSKILEMQGGLIPKYNSKNKLEKDGAYIVGDAAAQVKATTGGGLVPGLLAAEGLANSIEEETYYRNNIRPVNQELRMSLMLRNVLDRFNDADYNKLVELIDQEKIKKILDAEDRDRPSKIVFKSIIKEPKLLLFAKTLLRAKRL